MSKSFYLNQKPSRLFWSAAIPGSISMLASSLYGVFEAILVGKVLGTTSFAALNLSFSVVIINFALAELVGVGSSVPISIFLGQGDEEKANNYFTCSVLLTVITGFISGGTILLVAPTILRLLGASGDLLFQCLRYLNIYAICSPLATLMFSLDNYLRISGKVKASMRLNILMSMLSIILETAFLILIPLGISGVALGTNIAMIVSVVIALSMFFPGKLQLKFVRPKFSWSMVQQIYKNGISSFLTNISGRFVALLMNSMLLRFGGEAAVAVYGVIMSLFGVVRQLVYGVVDSLQPAIGYNYGAKCYTRVKSLETYVLTATALVSVAFSVLISVFPAASVRLFLEDTSLMSLAVFAVRISGISVLFQWFSISMQCFFMALEKPLSAMMISMSEACIFPVALIFTLMPLGLTGLWWNGPLSTLLTAVLALIIFLSRKNNLFT